MNKRLAQEQDLRPGAELMMVLTSTELLHGVQVPKGDQIKLHVETPVHNGFVFFTKKGDPADVINAIPLEDILQPDNPACIAHFLVKDAA